METKKCLISYLRKKGVTEYVITETPTGVIASKKYVKGEKKGVVIAIANGILGWALCNRKDTFDKYKGLTIATKRAMIAAEMTEEEMAKFYEKVPTTMKELFADMLEKSANYYK